MFLARDNLKKWVDDVHETRPEGLILRKETRFDTQKIDLKIGNPHHYGKEWPSMSSILDLMLGVTALAGMSDGVRNELVAVVTCIKKASVGGAVEIIHHYQQGYEQCSYSLRFVFALCQMYSHYRTGIRYVIMVFYVVP